MGQKQSTINLEALVQEIEQLSLQEAPLSAEQEAHLAKLNGQLTQCLQEHQTPVPWPVYSWTQQQGPQSRHALPSPQTPAT
jgi:hypothetical protein